MLEHSLGCDPWGTVLGIHTSLCCRIQLKTSVAVSPWMISSSILLLPMPVLAACHLDNNLPPAPLNPLDVQVSCQSLRL
jgi:hypothetical protein